MRSLRVPPIVLLGALVMLAYWPAFDCGFIWDDDDYVTQNPVLRTLGGIVSIWFEPTSLPQYYPLVHTTFWIEYRLFGAHPLGYHVVNVLLHLMSCIMLLRLLRRLAIPGALFAAAVFAVHPVGVESVAWVTERKNVLSLCLALLAARSWLNWQEHGSRRAWWLATAWFLGALLAKTVTASLPAALLVVQWWRNGRIERREVTAILPWLVLGLVFGIFTAWLEATHVHGADAPWQLVGGERLVVAGRAVWFYLAALLWPAGLCFNYPRWEIDAGSWLQWLPAAAAILTVVATFAVRRRIGRGPLAVLLLFGGTLVPALGFFDVYPFRFSYVADHFQYHASIAVIAGTAAALASIAVRLPRNVSSALCGVLILSLAVLANLHTRSYRDLETCWRTTLECNPDSMLALVNLGALLIDDNRLEEAQRCFERSLAIDAQNYESLANLGQLAHRRKDLVTARRYYEASLSIRRDQPATLSNFATLYMNEQQPEQALELAREAVDLDPDFYKGQVTLTWTLHATSRWKEAIEHANWVLMRTPDNSEVRLLVARSLLEVGDFTAATQNAAAILAEDMASPDARRIFVRAFARILRTRATEGLAAQAAQICRSGGLDPTALLPELATELRTLGASGHAAALTKRDGGR